MEKVVATKTIVLDYGAVRKCVVHINKGQRWYVVVKPDVEQWRDYYIIELDNVFLELNEKDFDDLFKPSMRGTKWE